MSGVMTQDGTPNVTLHTFDHIGNVHERFFDRLKSLKADPRVQLVPQFMVNTHSHLEQVEQSFLSEGYEGVIIRSPDAPYKMGRSTVREGGMLKLKRFMDAEAVVIGFQERMHNANELTQDELGYAKRSTYQENMRGRGDLGALLVRQDDMEFSIGTGFDDFQRKVIWANRNHYLGQLVKYKYFPTGSKNLPRFPVFLGFRDRRDI
jgi:DNA ligase-1